MELCSQTPEELLILQAVTSLAPQPAEGEGMLPSFGSMVRS